MNVISRVAPAMRAKHGSKLRSGFWCVGHNSIGSQKKAQWERSQVGVLKWDIRDAPGGWKKSGFGDAEVRQYTSLSPLENSKSQYGFE